MLYLVVASRLAAFFNRSFRSQPRAPIPKEARKARDRVFRFVPMRRARLSKPSLKVRSANSKAQVRLTSFPDKDEIAAVVNEETVAYLAIRFRTSVAINGNVR